MAKQLDDTTYRRIMEIVADARRQTANMVGRGRRDGVAEELPITDETFQLFSEAYQNADSIEELMRRLG